MTARITQQLDRESDLTTVVVSGAVDVEQMKTQVLGFLKGEPTQRVLWDIRNGSLEKLSMDDMRAIITEAAPHAHKRCGGRTAVLCTRAVDFGLARMFELVAEAYHIPFEIRVFLNEQHALDWLADVPALKER